jgi:Lrp/AsnC family transcriptional regulator, regulator for asnA, asnC and gidA
MRPMTVSLNPIDLALIDALREDGRRPNKSLARELGIAETTVASRIRQLRQDKVMLVTLRRDLYSKGFDLQCFADISVSGRSVDAVANELALIREVSSVSLMLGTPEIVVVFNAVDRQDLLRILEQEIAPVAGVTRTELHTAVDIRKYQTGYATLEHLD